MILVFRTGTASFWSEAVQIRAWCICTLRQWDFLYQPLYHWRFPVVKVTVSSTASFTSLILILHLKPHSSIYSKMTLNKHPPLNLTMTWEYFKYSTIGCFIPNPLQFSELSVTVTHIKVNFY